MTYDASEFSIPEPAPLPDGYAYADPSSITPQEFAPFYNTVEIGQGTTEIYLGVRKEAHEEMGLSVIDVGVRSEDGKLVGFGAALFKGTHGTLGDLVVDPEHQHKGIGKALVDRRLAEAEAIGVESFYLSDIQPTNSLRSYYRNLGFTENAEGHLVRGPDPTPLY